MSTPVASEPLSTMSIDYAAVHHAANVDNMPTGAQLCLYPASPDAT